MIKIVNFITSYGLSALYNLNAGHVEQKRGRSAKPHGDFVQCTTTHGHKSTITSHLAERECQQTVNEPEYITRINTEHHCYQFSAPLVTQSITDRTAILIVGEPDNANMASACVLGVLMHICIIDVSQFPKGMKQKLGKKK